MKANRHLMIGGPADRRFVTFEGRYITVPEFMSSLEQFVAEDDPLIKKHLYRSERLTCYTGPGQFDNFYLGVLDGMTMPQAFEKLLQGYHNAYS